MYKIFIRGIVQGVGFRPYIYRKAKENGLVGSVRNIGSGVEIIIDDRDFVDKLTDLPADIFMCNDCLRELRDERNRRNNYYFITCTNCGPRLKLLKNKVDISGLSDLKTIEKAVDLIRSGEIISIKGIGGFYFAVITSFFASLIDLREIKRIRGDIELKS